MYALVLYSQKVKEVQEVMVQALWALYISFVVMDVLHSISSTGIYLKLRARTPNLDDFGKLGELAYGVHMEHFIRNNVCSSIKFS